MAELKPFLDFLITQNCNYRCEYCSQSKANSTLEDASDDVIDGFLKALNNLPRDFEITISGGEPLLHKRFFEIIEKIKKMGFCVCIVSNFSSPFEKYEKIATILDDKLSFLMLSFHDAQVKNIDDYIGKAVKLKSKLNNSTKMRICAPLWKGNTNRLHYLKEKISPFGIEFEVQHIRIKNKFIEYAKDDMQFLKDNNAAPNKDFTSFGKICRAGVNSAVIYQNGKIYRCYSSRLVKTHYLGNVKEGEINFYNSLRPCPLLKCTCPKPFNYGMIDCKTNYMYALSELMLNFLHLPAKLIKKTLRL